MTRRTQPSCPPTNHPVHISYFRYAGNGVQDTSHRRAAAVGPKEPSFTEPRMLYVWPHRACGIISWPQSQPQARQYQSRPLPTLKGPRRRHRRTDRSRCLPGAKLRRCFAPLLRNLQPWTEHQCGVSWAIRYYRSVAIPVGALNLQLNTEAGSKFLSSVPVFDDRPQTWF
ncbi:hypothetical protein HPB51_005376 [Rhipicephalus microplus]|uniref:Uncharacterized protein n=1 Tax=Rhipicephalus microplus TaxID=6941 RepID=A0A9J6DFU2_RHIMP|nr:hypothetical protein HPB51_005376 [Rhipicephalus microplus]